MGELPWARSFLKLIMRKLLTCDLWQCRVVRGRSVAVSMINSLSIDIRELGLGIIDINMFL